VLIIVGSGCFLSFLKKSLQWLPLKRVFYVSFNSDKRRESAVKLLLEVLFLLINEKILSSPAFE